MVSVIKTAVLLLSVICCCSGSLIRSEEHKHSQNNALLFLEIMEENLIAEIRNFTATGYRSELFDLWSKSVPYTEEMTRVEVDDYPLVLPIHSLGKTYLNFCLNQQARVGNYWMFSLSYIPCFIDSRHPSWSTFTTSSRLCQFHLPIIDAIRSYSVQAAYRPERRKSLLHCSESTDLRSK